MLIKFILMSAASIGLIIFSVVGSANENSLAPVILSEDKLLESYFSADMIPHCAVELSTLYREDECYMSQGEERGVELKIIHRRFLKNIVRLEENGGEYKKLPEDSYALYSEAICSLGIVRSCALDEILRGDGVDVSARSVIYLMSGEAQEYYEELDGVYPKNYDPKNYEHFNKVVNSGLKILSLKAENSDK
ncbi:hypothetical protein [Microbulbifer sp. SSSA005]|uniref:hypothetical protein n=1 Tax=Microbulbifer sp. SSSA005 TaxID=3243378 RepID=UPI0040391037